MLAEDNLKSKGKMDNLRRIAHMYYILQMSQQEISEKMGISRSSVARFLGEARESGLVRIQIVSGNESVHNLREEGLLHQRFAGLNDIYVIGNNASINFFDEAARYIDTILPFNGRIGLGGGRTLLNVGECFRSYAMRPSLKLVQLTGMSMEKINCMSIVQTWSEGFHAQPYYIYSPDIEPNEEKRQVFLDDIAYKRAFRELGQLDMAIVSVGPGIDFERLQERVHPSAEVRQRLNKEVAGDIVGHFFNHKGVFDFPEISQSIIGITTEMFLKVPIRVCIACGKEKAAAIGAVLKSGAVNVLVTDEDAAKEILNE